MRISELECLDHVAMPVFVIDVSDDGQPFYSKLNKYALDFAGLTLDEIRGKTAKEIFSGRAGATAYTHHLAVIKTGKPIEYQIRLPVKTDIRLFKTSLSPILDTQGRVIQIIGTSADITELEIQRDEKMPLTRIGEEMEDYITLAAHDLRTPMRNVQHIADMMRDEFEDLGDGKVDLIDLLEDVAIKATSLISDVLAHAQASKAHENTTTFDFAELCGELYTILDPLANHQISTSEGVIKGDKTAYQIVIRNLLDNAFKHGGKEQLKLVIELTELPDGFIQVSVRDDGCGFPNPGIAFLETGKLRTDSGFGLLGVKRLITSRGGDISARSPSSGQGSLINFSLPGAYALSADTKSAPSTTSSPI